MHTRTKGFARALPIGLLIMTLIGCGNQPQESAATPPPDSGTALQPTEPPIPAPKAEPVPAQENQKPAESAQAPEGLPLPLYTGFKVVNTMRTQTGDFQGMQVEIISDAPLQAVSDFYEAEFKKLGLEVRKRAQRTAAGDESLVLGESEKITAGVSATREHNQTRVVLSWSEMK